MIFFAHSGATYAQRATLKFDKLVYDFGTFKEEGGKVKCRFTFKNDGEDTLRISTVKPGCGCTTAEWTKTGVLAKQSGYVDAEFDPAQRPGIFSKSLTVYSNDQNQPILSLTIKGQVLAKPKAVIDLYPMKMGNLLFESSQFNLTNAKNNEIRCDTIKYYNNWNKPINITFKDLSESLTAEAVPPSIKPKKEGLIIIHYDVAKRNDYGYIYDRMLLETDDSIQPEKTLNIAMNIVEDFSSLTPQQLADAPIIKFETNNYNFTSAKQGDKVACSFIFINEGKSDLIIHKVKASCGCTATSPEKTTLKPGESSKINATFDTAGKSGKQYKTITVVTNDPKNATLMLTIEGMVDKPETQTTPDTNAPTH